MKVGLSARGCQCVTLRVYLHVYVSVCGRDVLSRFSLGIVAVDVRVCVHA